MKKKILIVLLGVCLAIISVFVLTACGETDSEPHVHNYNFTWGKDEKKPTETEEGTATMTCIICGDSKTVTVPVLTDETVWNLDEDVKPDCITKGKRVYYSSVYGRVVVNFPFGNHDFGELIPLVKPTGNKTGTVEHYHCEMCEKDFAADGETEIDSLVIPRIEVHLDLEVATVKKGEQVRVYVYNNFAGEAGCTVTTDRDDLVKIENGVLTVIDDLYESATVTVTATSTDDPTVSESKSIIVKANLFDVNMSAKTVNPATGKESSVLRPGEKLQLAVDITNNSGDELGYSVDISCSGSRKDVVSYDELTGFLTISEKITAATIVDITVTPVANYKRTVTMTITLKPETLAEMNEKLTAAMICELAGSNITVSGTFTDVYLSNRTTYDYTVKMDSVRDKDGNFVSGSWYGMWNQKGKDKSFLNIGYKLGDNDTVLKSYIDKNNKVATELMKDDNGVAIKWSERHYWNCLEDLAEHVKKFKYDNDLGAYYYEAEHGHLEFDEENKIFNYITTDDEELLGSLSNSLTPVNMGFYDLYIYLDADEKRIDRIEANNYKNHVYEKDKDGNATDTVKGDYYTTATMYFSEIGTTIVEENPAPYEFDKSNTMTAGIYDALSEAIDKAKTMENYAFKIGTINMDSPFESNEYTIGVSTDKIEDEYDVYDGKIKPYYYKSTSGDVGSLGIVTLDTILINKTIQYDSVCNYFYHTNYRTDPYGYKQNTDGTYDVFDYNIDIKALKGRQKKTGNIHSFLPAFDVAPEIFEFCSMTGNATDGFKYTFLLRDSSIISDVINEFYLKEYAKQIYIERTTKFFITVDESDKTISSVRYGSSIGYYVIYTNIGTASIPSSVLESYVARIIPQQWSDYTSVETYVPVGKYDDGRTEFERAYLNGQAVLEGLFGATRAVNVPAPGIFSTIFDDNVFGPWGSFQRKGIDEDGNEKICYSLSLVAYSDNVDENNIITDLEEKINNITQALTGLGFEIDSDNCEGEMHDSKYIIVFASAEKGLQITIENNNSKNFWIKIYNYGEYNANEK